MKEILKIIRDNFLSWFWIIFLLITAVFIRSNTPQMQYDIRISREYMAQLMLAAFFIVIISGLIPQIREYKNGLIAILLGWILYSNARAFTTFSLQSIINIALYSFLFFSTVKYLPTLHIDKILKALCWFLALQCFWCFIQLCQYDCIFLDALSKDIIRNRPVGTMDNESLFGAYLSFLIPLCFIWHKWQWNLVGIIAIGFLFISKSITAISGGFVGIMTLIFLRSQIKKIQFKFLKWWIKICFRKAFSIVLIFLSIISFGLYCGKIVTYHNKELKILFKDKQIYHFDLHDSGRLQHWKESLQLSKPVSWSGLGIGNYKPFMVEFMKGQTARKYAQAHNDYLQMLNETGIIGIMIYIAFLGMILKGMWRGAKKYTYMKSVMAGFVAFLVNSLAFFPVHVTALICPIVFFIAIGEITKGNI